MEWPQRRQRILFTKGLAWFAYYMEEEKRLRGDYQTVARLGALMSFAAYETSLLDGLPDWEWPVATLNFNGE